MVLRGGALENGGFAFRARGEGLVIYVPDTRHLVVFAASVDIVYLEANSIANIGFVAREVEGQTNGYSGFAGFAASQSSAVILNHNDGPPYNTVASKTWAQDPGRQYRLQFKGSGSQLTFEVFSLTDPNNPIVAVEGTNDRYTEGELGLILQWGGGPDLGIRLDNLVLRGTTPTP